MVFGLPYCHILESWVCYLKCLRIYIFLLKVPSMFMVYFYLFSFLNRNDIKPTYTDSYICIVSNTVCPNISVFSSFITAAWRQWGTQFMMINKIVKPDYTAAMHKCSVTSLLLNLVEMTQGCSSITHSILNTSVGSFMTSCYVVYDVDVVLQLHISPACKCFLSNFAFRKSLSSVLEMYRDEKYCCAWHCHQWHEIQK